MGTRPEELFGAGLWSEQAAKATPTPRIRSKATSRRSDWMADDSVFCQQVRGAVGSRCSH
jgi:hypothetical protein